MINRAWSTFFVIVVICLGFYSGGGGCSGNSGNSNSVDTDVILLAKDIHMKLVRLDGTKLDLGSRPIPIRVALEVTFPVKMNTFSVEGALSVHDPDGKLVSGVITWNDDKTVLTFLPSANLNYHATYGIEIAASALSDSGAPIEKILAYFETMTKGDVNGDGSTDVVIGVKEVEPVANGVYYWDDSRIKTDHLSYIFNGAALSGSLTTANAFAKIAVSNARIMGDINADGYSDIIAGKDFVETPTELPTGIDTSSANYGIAYIFNGGHSLGNLTPENASATIDPRAEGGGLYISDAGSGEINGDGYEDLIVRGYENSFVFSGKGLSGKLTSENAFATIHEMVALKTIGDVNADGKCDVVGTRLVSENGKPTKEVGYIFNGATLVGTKTTNDAMAILSDIDTKKEGDRGEVQFSKVGDVNNDGKDDLIVYSRWQSGCPGGSCLPTMEETLYIFSGSDFVGNVSKIKAISITTQDSYSYFPSSGAGDVNGDGYNDLIFNNKYIFSGKSLSGALVPENALATIADTDYAAFTASVGDINMDQYDDILISEYPKEAAYVFSGAMLSGTKKLSDAIATITCVPSSEDLLCRIQPFIPENL
ncbi:MAG: hypothetical protein COS89_05235 [Deltaproteobacteria bacterium CG07_land_8_20_14_0_80_38_7]|nr:MAG: hypothetical protein COS89_05235 [Deltaproteobacteria bacterium CG07_land_8_20_14_0_80_38_7]